MAVYKNANFSTRLRVKVLLKHRMQSWIDYLSRPLTKILWSTQYALSWALSPHALHFFILFYFLNNTPVQPQTACCLIGRLPICMMESALAELHCNIHRERQISSNSISGFQQGGSSKLCSAVLYCPNGAPKAKKKKEKKKEEEEMIKTQCRTRTAVLLLLADQIRMKPRRNDQLFLFLKKSKNQQKQTERRKVSSKKKRWGRTDEDQR